MIGLLIVFYLFLLRFLKGSIIYAKMNSLIKVFFYELRQKYLFARVILEKEKSLRC